MTDNNFIYEIGPGMVYLEKPTFFRKMLMRMLYAYGFCKDYKQMYGTFLEEAQEHIGYHRIKDCRGRYIYPQDLQMKLASTIDFLNGEKKPRPQRH